MDTFHFLTDFEFWTFFSSPENREQENQKSQGRTEWILIDASCRGCDACQIANRIMPEARPANSVQICAVISVLSVMPRSLWKETGMGLTLAPLLWYPCRKMTFVTGEKIGCFQFALKATKPVAKFMDSNQPKTEPNSSNAERAIR
jgi:hypothetical protein